MEKPLWDNVNGVNTMPKAVSIWLVRWNILIPVDTAVYCFMFTANFCKVVGCTGSIGLLPAALGPSFLDKGVGTDPVAIQFGPVCTQTMPSLPRMCLRQAELFQVSCGRQI